MVPIKKRSSSFLCHPALPSFHLHFLVVCSFLLHERTISGVDIIEMMLKGGIDVCLYSQQLFPSNGPMPSVHSHSVAIVHAH